MQCSNSEVQLHGFSWEKEILTNIYGLSTQEIASIKYTSKMDLPAEYNRLDGANVSVKTTGYANTVCMADCLRVFDAVNEKNTAPFHLLVITYKQDDSAKCKRVVSIILVDLTDSSDELFGSVSREQIVELDKCVKSVPQKRRPTDEEYTKMYNLRNLLITGALHLDIKCNSQQSRLQCSFNKFQEFIENHPTRVLFRGVGAEFRGGQISPSIVSGRRIFRKSS